MKKDDVISIIQLSIYLIGMVYLLVLYRFNFDLSKVDIFIILKWYPASLFITVVFFYLKKSD
ncbi:hypothetical protein BKK48_01655 [Rodentibacter heidelbergensis]|uniref:UDP-diphosphatase n=1 Tax=Rodentibacter heidelbergensis TaxID=1908258 RepID=A0A1V3IC14_9PAST|nr:hypothetical protein BKK48_01655 [Rodentibacter heidelbergensis]